jgi:RNA-directed DNA polymerase
MTSKERHEARYQRRVVARKTKKQQKLSQYDNFGLVTNVDNLYNSFNKCKIGVSWKESIQRYESNALKNVLETRRKLLAGESVQNGFVEFTLRERGKIRHIKSVHISERVVQKCLCDEILVPILTNPLIHDNGASVKGKGTHFAIKRLICHMTKYCRQNNYSNKGYVLAIDFSKFFDSIDHQTLFAMLEERIKDIHVRRLTRNLITVFGDGKSLGLGSQISQVCAIFFPNQLDHFIKEKLGIKYYGRYMDDLYLIHRDKVYLEFCLTEIQKVCETLKITVNLKKTRITKLSDGLIFLKGKYSLLETGKILRLPGKESTKRMRRKLVKFKSLIDSGKMDYKDLRIAYQSWRGTYKRRFNAYYSIRYMDKLYNELFINTHN